MQRILFFFCLGLAGFAFSAQAMEPPGIIVENAYAYATAPGQKNGAIFLTIINFGDQEDRLITATAKKAEKTELHTHIMDKGIMMMRKVEGYNLPPRVPVALEPMGHHIMLIGLHTPLKAGETFPLTLGFDQHWDVLVHVTVRNPGETGHE